MINQQSLGPAHTYQEGYFLDYPPGYLYALWVAGLISNAIGATGDFWRVIVEGPAIVADFALAILVYAASRQFPAYRNSTSPTTEQSQAH